MATALDAKVRDQFDRFRRDLPSMLPDHHGQWVVYLDGAKSFFASEREALRWAYKSLDASDGFVVAEVAEPEPVLLTAALAFRLDA